MPWARRADGTWGNVEVPTPTPPPAESLPPSLPPPELPQPRKLQTATPTPTPTKRRPAPAAPIKTPKPIHLLHSSNGFKLPVPPQKVEEEAQPPVVAPWLAEIRQARPDGAAVRGFTRTPSPQSEIEEEEPMEEEDETEEEEEQEAPRPPRPGLPKRVASTPLPAAAPHRRPAPPIPTRMASIELPLPSSSAPPIPTRPPLPSRPLTTTPPPPTLSSFNSTPPPTSHYAPPTTSHRPPPTRNHSGGSSTALRDPSRTPTWSDDKTGYAKNKAIEFTRNRLDPLNPPPVCFSRIPPETLDLTDDFVPIVLRSSHSNDLAKALTTGRAFPKLPPPIPTRDVWKEDWERLWEDIDEMARVELRTSAGISVATLPLAPIFGAGFAVGQLVERKLRAKRVGPTCGLVEAWNERFFRPRNLDVYIAQGGMRLSGPTLTAESRKVFDPAYIQMQEATNEVDKQKAMRELEKYDGKFRFVVQNWR